MMTRTEARQRANVLGARIRFDRNTGEYRVTLNEWPEFRVSTEERAYYTTCIEDAVITAGAMRREQCNAASVR